MQKLANAIQNAILEIATSEKKFRSIVSNRKSRSCSSQVVVQKNQLTNEPFGIHNRHWIAKEGSQENIKALHCQFQIPFKYEPPYFDLYKKDSHICYFNSTVFLSILKYINHQNSMTHSVLQQLTKSIGYCFLP